MAKISVIIPVYNRENFIRPVIESVLNQTFQDFEVIVVDDASTDKTKEIVKELQKKDKRIKLIELEKNSGGPTIPTNIGIQNSISPFISILESDDLYLPNFLEIKFNHLERNKLDWSIGSSFYVFLKDFKFIKYVKGAPVSTWMLRKKLFKEIGYFKEEQDIFQDLGFSIRIRKFKKVKIGILEYPATICFVHNKSNTYFLNDVKNKSLIFKKRLISLLEEVGEMKNWESFLFLKIGNYSILGGKLKEGRKYFKKSLETQFNKAALFLYILSFFGRKIYFLIWKTLWLIKNILLKKLELIFYILFKYRKEYLTAKAILKSFSKLYGHLEK